MNYINVLGFLTALQCSTLHSGDWLLHEHILEYIIRNILCLPHWMSILVMKSQKKVTFGEYNDKIQTLSIKLTAEFSTGDYFPPSLWRSIHSKLCKIMEIKRFKKKLKKTFKKNWMSMWHWIMATLLCNWVMCCTLRIPFREGSAVLSISSTAHHWFARYRATAGGKGGTVRRNSSKACVIFVFYMEGHLFWLDSNSSKSVHHCSFNRFGGWRNR